MSYNYNFFLLVVLRLIYCFCILQLYLVAQWLAVLLCRKKGSKSQVQIPAWRFFSAWSGHVLHMHVEVSQWVLWLPPKVSKTCLIGLSKLSWDVSVCALVHRFLSCVSLFYTAMDWWLIKVAPHLWPTFDPWLWLWINIAVYLVFLCEISLK